MLDEVVGLCGFVATAPVAVWVAIKDCCSVCSVLLGCLSVACHKADATSALGFACGCLLACVSLGCLCPPHFTAVCCWLPDCLGWTPYAFCVVRELCTGDLPQQPFTLSHLGWLGAPALPTFPCVKYQQSAIPYVALVVISCELATCVSLG